MDERVARALVVAKVLAADGMMAPAEKEFLARLLCELGLDEAQCAQVYAFEGLEEADAEIAGLPEAERRALVDRVVEAALVDGKLSPLETQVVAKLTEALDLA